MLNGRKKNIFFSSGGVFVTWRQKDRDYAEELGLYGKQTIDSFDDDLFLVEEYCRIRKTRECFENDDRSCGKLPFVQCRVTSITKCFNSSNIWSSCAWLS